MSTGLNSVRLALKCETFEYKVSCWIPITFLALESYTAKEENREKREKNEQNVNIQTVSIILMRKHWNYVNNTKIVLVWNDKMPQNDQLHLISIRSCGCLCRSARVCVCVCFKNWRKWEQSTKVNNLMECVAFYWIQNEIEK